MIHKDGDFGHDIARAAGGSDEPHDYAEGAVLQLVGQMKQQHDAFVAVEKAARELVAVCFTTYAQGARFRLTAALRQLDAARKHVG